MKLEKKKSRIIITVCASVVALSVLLPLLLSIYIYQANFGERFETAAWVMRSIDEFDGLHRERHAFQSNNGQELVGYTYYKEGDAPKGVVIIAHGLGGGGHNTYMDVAEYLAANGYIVFAYDATGNDESEGDSVIGVPQGLIDLDYAVRYVKANPYFNGLPVMLFGHSWGAYAAGSVLNIHPDIKAVVMVAGFNKSADVIEEEGGRIMGSGIKVVMPFISLIERVKFGKYASYSCMEGFEASSAGVMVIHSSDDDMISYENHFVTFSNAYYDNRRFVFVGYEDRGHNHVFYSDTSKDSRAQYNQQFAQYIDSTGLEVNAERKTEYMKEHGDNSTLFALDTELMDRIVSFYNGYAR